MRTHLPANEALPANDCRSANKFPPASQGTRAIKRAHSIHTALEQLGVAQSTIWKYAKMGKICLTRIGGRTLLSDQELCRLASGGIQ